MAILDKIEVRIRSNGEILTEYHDPDQAAPQDTKTTTKFIEATSGAKFSIDVLLEKGYHFHTRDCIRVKLHMDGQCCAELIISKTAPGSSVTKRSRYNLDRATRFDSGSRQWKEVFYSFGQLDILEHSELPDDFDTQKAMQLGTIKLTFSHVYKQRMSVPRTWTKGSEFNSVDRISEKILKGKAIENNIRYVDERVVPQPLAHEYKYVDLMGPHGGSVEFRFQYRSKNALQILGCIPRSASPAIVIEDDEEAKTKPVPATSDPENTELEISQRAKERERLQAELARLDQLDQAARGVKVEAGRNENTTGERNTVPSLKREFEENNVRIKREQSGSRKRSRTSGPAETVDLTAD